MSDFKKIRVTFSMLKLQKCVGYQNGTEFCHKPNGNDVQWPPPLYLLLVSLAKNMACTQTICAWEASKPFSSVISRSRNEYDDLCFQFTERKDN